MDCECDPDKKDKFLKQLRDMTLSVRVMARTPTEDEGEREREGKREGKKGFDCDVLFQFLGFHAIFKNWTSLLIECCRMVRSLMPIIQ